MDHADRTNHNKQPSIHPQNHRPVREKRTLGAPGYISASKVELNGIVWKSRIGRFDGLLRMFQSWPHKANSNLVFTGSLQFPFVPVAVPLFVEWTSPTTITQKLMIGSGYAPGLDCCRFFEQGDRREKIIMKKLIQMLPPSPFHVLNILTMDHAHVLRRQNHPHSITLVFTAFI